MGIRVSVASGQFNVLAFFAHQAGKLFSKDGRTLIVVGDDLGNCNAFLTDFAVDEEGGDAGVFGFLDSGYGGIGACIVENDGFRALTNAAFNQLELLVGIVVVDEFQGGVAQFFRFLGGNFLH